MVEGNKHLSPLGRRASRQTARHLGLEAETAAFGYLRERLFWNSGSGKGPLAIRDLRRV
jgi:hypothetical protein